MQKTQSLKPSSTTLTTNKAIHTLESILSEVKLWQEQNKSVPWKAIAHGKTARLFDLLGKNHKATSDFISVYIMKCINILKMSKPEDSDKEAERIRHLRDRVKAWVIQLGWTPWDVAFFFDTVIEQRWGSLYGGFSVEHVIPAMRQYQTYRLEQIRRQPPKPEPETPNYMTVEQIEAAKLKHAERIEMLKTKMTNDIEAHMLPIEERTTYFKMPNGDMYQVKSKALQSAFSSWCMLITETMRNEAISEAEAWQKLGGVEAQYSYMKGILDKNPDSGLLSRSDLIDVPE